MYQPFARDQAASFDFNKLGGPGINVVGTSGNDQIFGTVGNDTLLGGAGDDQLIGSNGSDVLFGGDGNDTLFGGTGDTLWGGAGENVIVVNINPGDKGPLRILDFTGGQNAVYFQINSSAPVAHVNGQTFVITDDDADIHVTVFGFGHLFNDNLPELFTHGNFRGLFDGTDF